MRILHVISSVGKTQGGTSEVVPRLCEALHAEGHEVRLITCKFGDLSDAAVRARDAGVELCEYALTGLPGRLVRYSKGFANDIRTHVEWADAVHLHGLWQWPCWCAGWQAQEMGKPYLMMPHGFLEPERLKISAFKKKLVGKLIERGLLSRASAIIATAESERQGILQYGVVRPVEVIPIGLDTDKIDAAQRDDSLLARLGVPAGKKVILYFSRITPIKGLDLLAEAWRQLAEKFNDWHLLMVGPDDRGYAAKMRELYELRCPPGSWTIHGPVFAEDKYKLLKSVELFVLPTRSENWSIAVEESLAAGVPVICTKGAPWSGIEGGLCWGKCGWWVDISSKAISEGLCKGMRMDEVGRRAFGVEGKKLVALEFNWSSVANKMCQIYAQIS